MKFHIIIPTYNRKELLPRALESVLNQKNIKNFDFHIYIIDDGSTDNTKKVIQKYLEKYPEKITYKYKENWWVWSARNIWIELALQNSDNPENDWIIFLDSDDELINDAFEKFKKYINKYGWIYKHIIFLAQNEKWDITWKLIPNQEIDFEKCISWKYFNWELFWLLNLSIFLNKKFRFEENINWWESLLWWRLYKDYKAYTINNIIRIYHQDNESLIRINHFKLNNEQIANNIKILEKNLEYFKNDLLKIWNKKQIWTWYLVLARMYNLKWEKIKWLKYFLKWIKYNFFDIKRIWAFILSYLKLR